MATIFYDDAADLELIRRRRIGLVGYGNQGRAQALNLRDTGCLVRIGLPPGSGSRRLAESDGFEVDTVANVARWASVIGMLLPDQHQTAVFEESIRSGLDDGDMLLFAHGFAVHFGGLVPPAGVDVALLAPVGPGAILRRLAVQQMGIPAVVAVHQDASGKALPLALAYARALGCTRAGVVLTTFQEETESDLFGEQVVLCGGLSALIDRAFTTLVEAGYQPELAYFECVHQVKLIADLIYADGLAAMFERISDTAEYGAQTAGPRLIDDRVAHTMRSILGDIQRGDFSRRWMDEVAAGMPQVKAERARRRSSLQERIGSELRAMMPWLRRTSEVS